MKITADLNKISKTVQTSIVLAKKNVGSFTYNGFSQKCGSITVRNYAGIYIVICSYNLMYNFLIQLLPLQSSVFVLHFSNVFWHGNKVFPKGSSQNEIVPHFVIFHLPYSKYRSVEVCFHSCRYQNQNFSLVLHTCRSCSTRVARVARVSVESHSYSSCLALVL